MKKLKDIYSNYNKYLDKVKKYINSFVKKYSYLIKPFLFFFIIYAFAIYPIIRANFNYSDDIGRVYLGYHGWDDFSRFISHYFSTFVHAGIYLTDISPLTQIIAVMFLSISSVVILYLFKKDKKITFLNIVSIIPLGLTPYFLECLSYKYDSPYMALSILSSVLPFIFYKKDSKYNISFIIATFIGINIMCMTYQAASGIFPLITLFLAFKYWNEDKELKSSIKLIVISVISYLLGMAFFKIFILVPVDMYASSSVLDLNNLIPGVIKNFSTYYSYILTDFRGIELLFIGLSVVFYIIFQVINSKQKKWLSLIISCIVVLISFLIVFGAYPILDKPSFEPRGMYGFGALLALICFNATNYKNTFIPKIVVFSLCWCLFTFAFTYGNVLSEEKRFIDFRIQNVINGLNDLEIMTNDVPKTIKLVGVSRHTPVMDHMPKSYYQKLERLVPYNFNGGWYWGNQLFATYYRIPNITIEYDESSNTSELVLFKDTAYYKIETNNYDYILITIK